MNIDLNDKWAEFAGPGGFNDPDMLQVGKGRSSVNEWRTNFVLWAIANAPLLLLTNLSALAIEHPSLVKLLTLKEVLAINQDAAGIQARKLVVDGRPVGKLVGVEPCAAPDQVELAADHAVRTLLYARLVCFSSDARSRSPQHRHLVWQRLLLQSKFGRRYLLTALGSCSCGTNFTPTPHRAADDASRCNALTPLPTVHHSAIRPGHIHDQFGQQPGRLCYFHATPVIRLSSGALLRQGSIQVKLAPILHSGLSGRC